MKKLASVLKRKLDGARKVAILGVGSDIRGDDAAGIIVAQLIKKITAKKKSKKKVKVFLGQTAPENLTGEIKKFNPSHLLIIDSADLGGRPGKVAAIDPENIGGISFCTHSLPIKVMTDYLQQSCPGLQVIIIGIQPESLAVGSDISRDVARAVEKLAGTLAELLNAAFA